MEPALVGGGVSGGINNMSEFKVLNHKKAMQSPGAEYWWLEIANEKA